MIDWISVKERLPKASAFYEEDEKVLIKYRGMKYLAWYRVRKRRKFFIPIGLEKFIPLNKITHWAQINEPEKKDA